MAQKTRSFRALADNPYGRKILKIFRNLVTLSGKKKNYIDEVLEITEQALKAREENIAAGLLSKHQYVAIVGAKSLDEKSCYEVAAAAGFTKSNVRLMTELHSFKSGKYAEAIMSPNCVAVIFGAIPHSHSGSIENSVKEKAVFARSNQGVHGKLKLTRTTLKTSFAEVRRNIEKNQIRPPAPNSSKG